MTRNASQAAASEAAAGRQPGASQAAAGLAAPGALCWTASVWSAASDAELLARQSALQAEAAELLTGLDLAATVADIGPLLLTGSFVSGLMGWREIDVMLLAGPDFSPQDVLRLLARIVATAPVTALEYHDERGPRCPTGQRRDERYHVPMTVHRAAAAPWCLDLSLWLHDPHQNVTRWHEELRERITAGERRAVLRIKDEWHRRPDYPDQVGGLDIYTAVLDGGVRTPAEFAAWLAHRAAEQPGTEQPGTEQPGTE